MEIARPPVPGRRPARQLPAWHTPLAVIAHPDDETFGLGAIIGRMAQAGARPHVLSFTRGEASTLGPDVTDLGHQREHELRQAGAVLGVAAVALLDYPDGRLAATPPGELAAHVTALVAHHRADGLLAFDDTGITGHPDHRAATAAAVLAGGTLGLPVLAWVLPADVAARLRAETGQPFAGQPLGAVDFRIPVNRAGQRRAAWLHASQISPAAVLWRRLELQGDTEHLRWLLRPAADPV